MPVSDQEQIAVSIKEHSRGTDLDQVKEDALERAREGWQNSAYFKALIETADVATLERTPITERIALNIPVDEGEQYMLGHITFKNNRAVTNTQFLRNLFPIKDGDLFSREKIATGLQKLREAYTELGYIDFTSIPDTTFEEEEGQEKQVANLDIDMDEGKLFYVGSIDALGLSEPERTKVLADSPLQRGQLYNSRLVGLFMEKHGLSSDDPARQLRDLDEKRGIVKLTFDFRACSVR